MPAHFYLAKMFLRTWKRPNRHRYDVRRSRNAAIFRTKSGEDGIRTRGAVLPAHRFSKPALSATQPPLRKSKKLGQVRRRPFPMLGLIYEMIMARAVGCEQGGFSPGLPALLEVPFFRIQVFLPRLNGVDRLREGRYSPLRFLAYPHRTD